jgi:hypothetical protein
MPKVFYFSTLSLSQRKIFLYCASWSDYKHLQLAVVVRNFDIDCISFKIILKKSRDQNKIIMTINSGSISN